MPRITHEQEEELYRLRTERSALDQLMSRMASYEAAMRVLVKHELMQEFAEEIRFISSNQQAPNDPR